MLNELFPNLTGNFGATNLTTGARPESLNGTEKDNLKSYAMLPVKATEETINNAAKLAGELEAQTILLKETSNQYDAVQKAALANFQARVDHSKKAMQNEKEFQKKAAQQGKNVFEYRTQVEATKQNMQGFESQFNASLNSINI